MRRVFEFTASVEVNSIKGVVKKDRLLCLLNSPRVQATLNTQVLVEYVGMHTFNALYTRALSRESMVSATLVWEVYCVLCTVKCVVFARSRLNR